MVRSEGNTSLKNPVTPPGIDPGTVVVIGTKFHIWKVRGGIEFRFVRVPRIMWLVAGFSPWSPKLNPRPIHVGFVANNVRLEQVFLREPRCFQYHSTSSSHLFDVITEAT